MTSEAEPKPLTAREAMGCAGFALGLVCVIIACLLLTTAPGAVHRWMHADGYQVTEAVVSESSRQYRRSIDVRIVSTGEELRVKRSDFESPLVEGARPVLYNPRAFSRRFGIIWWDSRIIGNVNADLRRDAILLTSGVIAFFTAAYLLLTAERLPETMPGIMTRQRRRLRERLENKARRRARME